MQTSNSESGNRGEQNAPVLSEALKAAWIAALRSNEFTQERHSIGSLEDKKLCCLGVGAHVAEPQSPLGCTAEAVAILCSVGLGEWRELDWHEGYEHLSPFYKTLIDMNDKQGKSFAEIADYIEANIPAA